MKIITYIKYFYFLVDNWDFKVAWYIIKEEIRGERKYNINTTGADELVDLEELGVDTSLASVYMPVSYNLLEEIFEQLPKDIRNHFVDIGCGKGRALCMAAHQGFKQITGLDFSKNLCDIAIKNLQKTKKKLTGFTCNVVNNDAFYYEIPDDTDCIFFFNPFEEIIMSGVVDNIFKSLELNPRKIKIIYVNPIDKHLFLQAGYKQIWYSKKMKYLEAIILEN